MTLRPPPISPPPGSEDDTPPVESTLARLVREAADVKDTSTKGGEGKQSSFPWALIAAGLVALLMAFLGFTAVLARRKAARLQHELNVREEKALQARERVDQEKRVNERAELEVHAARLREEVEALRTQRANLEARRREYEARVRAVVTWADVEVIDRR